MIRNNQYKYLGISNVLSSEIPKRTYYYKAKERDNGVKELAKLINGIFRCICNVYGQRNVKVELGKFGCQVSRRRIGQIMKEQGLVSKYTVAQFEPMKSKVNEVLLRNRKYVEFL